MLIIVITPTAQYALVEKVLSQGFPYSLGRPFNLRKQQHFLLLAIYWTYCVTSFLLINY